MLLANSARRPHFIGYDREDTPFYWVSLGRHCGSFFYYAQNNVGGWLEFQYMVHA